MVLVFKLSGQAGTGALRQLLYLGCCRKLNRKTAAAASTTNPVVLKSHTQTHPHKKIYAIFGSQHYQWKSWLLWNPTLEQAHTNTYLIFRRQVYQSISTPLKFTENSHWLRFPSYGCQGDVQMEKRDQKEVSTSTDIQHMAKVIPLQQF